MEEEEVAISQQSESQSRSVLPVVPLLYSSSIPIFSVSTIQLPSSHTVPSRLHLALFYDQKIQSVRTMENEEKEA